MRLRATWLMLLSVACGRIDFDGTRSWVEVGESASGGGVSQVPPGVDIETPRVAVGPSGRPVVAWSDDRTGNLEIRVRRWDGSAWIDLDASGGGVSNDLETSRVGALAVGANDQPCVCWNSEESYSLLLRCWNGMTWVGLGGSDVGIPNAGIPWWPDLVVSPIPMVAWQDYGAQPPSIYLRELDGATGWIGIGGSASGTGISGTGGESINVSIATAADGSTWIGWERLDVGDVFVATWTGSSWVTRGNVSATATLSERPAFDVGTLPYMVWMENSAGGPAIHARAWDGSSWIELGGSATGNGVSGVRTPAYFPRLATGSDGAPIVAFQHAGDIYVVRWDGSAWSLLGDQSVVGGVSMSGVADWPEIAVGPDGTVFVLWEEIAAGSAKHYLKALPR